MAQKEGETQKPAERSPAAEYFWKIRARILNLGWYLPTDKATDRSLKQADDKGKW